VIRATVLVTARHQLVFIATFSFVWRRSHFELWVPKRACWPT